MWICSSLKCATKWITDSRGLMVKVNDNGVFIAHFILASCRCLYKTTCTIWFVYEFPAHIRIGEWYSCYQDEEDPYKWPTKSVRDNSDLGLLLLLLSSRIISTSNMITFTCATQCGLFTRKVKHLGLYIPHYSPEAICSTWAAKNDLTATSYQCHVYA